MATTDSVPASLTPETLGTGVYDPMDFRRFSPDEANPVRMYAGDPDQIVVVWNLEPGQENALHFHPENAHVQVVMEGTGVYLREGEEPVPISAGQYVIVPRGVVHGIRNTGGVRLSYAAFTTVGSNGYVKKDAAQ